MFLENIRDIGLDAFFLSSYDSATWLPWVVRAFDDILTKQLISRSTCVGNHHFDRPAHLIIHCYRHDWVRVHDWTMDPESAAQISCCTVLRLLHFAIYYELADWKAEPNAVSKSGRQRQDRALVAGVNARMKWLVADHALADQGLVSGSVCGAPTQHPNPSLSLLHAKAY